MARNFRGLVAIQAQLTSHLLGESLGTLLHAIQAGRGAGLVLRHNGGSRLLLSLRTEGCGEGQGGGGKFLSHQYR